MARRHLPLSVLLESTAAAMARANTRLAAAGAPALLREFHMEVSIFARPTVEGGELVLSRRRSPTIQQRALMKDVPANIHISATTIAAPALVPAP